MNYLNVNTVVKQFLHYNNDGVIKNAKWMIQNLNNIEIIEHNGILTKEEYIRKNPAGYYEFINKINF